MRKVFILAAALVLLALPTLAQAQTANPAGLWMSRSAQMEWILLLAPNGDYAEKVTTQQGVKQYQGKWQVQGQQIIVQVQGAQQPAVLQFQMPNANALRLTMNGQFLGQLVRQQMQQQQQMPQQHMQQQRMPQQQMPMPPQMSQPPMQPPAPTGGSSKDKN